MGRECTRIPRIPAKAFANSRFFALISRLILLVPYAISHRRFELQQAGRQLHAHLLAVHVDLLNELCGKRNQDFFRALYHQEWGLATTELYVLDPSDLASGVAHNATNQ